MLGTIATLLAATPLLNVVMASPLYAKAAYYNAKAAVFTAIASNLWGK